MRGSAELRRSRTSCAGLESRCRSPDAIDLPTLLTDCSLFVMRSWLAELQACRMQPPSDSAQDRPHTGDSSGQIHATELLPRAGRHFLQIPGPDAGPRPHPAGDGHADHRPPRAGIRQARPSACSTASRPSSRPRSPVIIYPASGTGAWEAALVNTLSPGDTVLMVETGHFATLWKKMAEQARPQARVHRDRLAPRRRSRRRSRRG